jgi:signal transduction histidine kinase
MSETRTIEKLLRQQAALADFGSFAFRESDLEKILTEAARICAQSLGVPFAKICRYRAAENDLLVVAGCGWHAGVVGYVISEANESSTQGRAFTTGEAVILQDVSKNNSFHLPPFYAEHGIVATVDVLIKGRGDAWGVLEVDSAKARKFDKHDIVFLTGFANVVAEAVATVERAGVLRAAFERMELAVAEKDRLLAERLVRELRLREMQAQLLHLARVNAMGQMSAAIAHELNQPLAAIVNYAGAAQRTLDSGNLDSGAIVRTQELIGKVRELTLRAGGILKNLRNIVQNRDSVRVTEDLNQVLADATTLVLFGAAEEGVSVVFDFDVDAPQVLIDKVQIQQVLVNLVRNSLEAMRDVSARSLLLSTQAGSAGFANVTVQDTGPGLPPAIVEKLFLPFLSTKDSGMGLGLMICQTLVEANGGRIWRMQDLAVGTGFCFSLPLAPATKNRESALI